MRRLERLEPSRKGTRRDPVLQILVVHRLLDPSSEWRLYRHWFEHSAMADLLGADLELAQDSEVSVLAQSQGRVNKERAMHRRQLNGLWKRLKKMREMKPTRDALLKKLGAAIPNYPVEVRFGHDG